MGRPSSHCVWCTRIRSFCLLKTCGDKSASAHTDSQGGITGRAHTLDVKHTCDVLHPKSVQALPWSGIYCFAAACMFPLIWWMSKCFWIGSVTHVTNDMLTSPHTYLISCCSCNTCHWPQYLLIKCFVTHEQSSASVASPNTTLTFTQSFLTVHKQITRKYPIACDTFAWFTPVYSVSLWWIHPTSHFLLSLLHYTFVGLVTCTYVHTEGGRGRTPFPAPLGECNRVGVRV